jgi:hypothetical protein
MSEPKIDLNGREPLPVPYLQNIPETVTLTPGRQLFVDDYLIDLPHTSMTRTYHRPAKYSGNPVFFPESAEETDPQFPPSAITKSGGVWFDDRDQLFKMWYMAGYLGYAALATSQDGIHWERPENDLVPGTNLILPKDVHPDSGSVMIDHEAKDGEPRYKMLIRQGDEPNVYMAPAQLYTSHDGVDWQLVGESGPMFDRSTMFYNPLSKKWVQSIRHLLPPVERVRLYHDSDTFIESAQWKANEPIPWMRTDYLDHGKYNPAQLYNFDAIGYESILIGFHQILHGPDNEACEAVGIPKLSELYLSSSRDGFHWHRPDRTPFIPARREYGSWEYGYVESGAGICCIVGDELWFYYNAFAGDSSSITKDWKLSGMYANGAVGLAKLRRDGFASMRPGCAGAIMQTRALRFQGIHLFINANTAGSELTIAVLDSEGAPIAGFGHSDCIPFTGNSTCIEVRWKNTDFMVLRDQTICLQFKMDRGDLYAFWMAESEQGKSGGYTAAGGPNLKGQYDL